MFVSLKKTKNKKKGEKKMTNWKATGISIGLLMAIVGSVMFVADIGIGQSYEVISADDGGGVTANSSVTAATFAGIGQTVNVTTAGNVGVTDRIVVACMFLTVATGLGLVSARGAGKSKAERTILQFYPLIGMAVGLTVFATQVQNILMGDFDWTVGNDAYNGMLLAVSGWTISGVLRLLNTTR